MRNLAACLGIFLLIYLGAVSFAEPLGLTLVFPHLPGTSSHWPTAGLAAAVFGAIYLLGRARKHDD